MKECTGCHEQLPLAAFSPSKRDEKPRRCRDCVNAARRTLRQGAHLRKERLWSDYRLTVEAYEELLASQGSRCAGCSEKFTSTPHVDHDHSCCSGRRSCGRCIRGLLCRHCNWALGNVKDNLDRLRGLLDYVERAGVVVA